MSIHPQEKLLDNANRKDFMIQPISVIKPIIAGLCTAVALLGSGCATTELLEGDREPRVHTYEQKKVLLNDRLVAFGRPVQPLPNLPAGNVVIIGERNSFVLTTGGDEMVNILSSLDPKNIHVDSAMDFYSPNNDGYFQGEMKMSYAKLKDEFKRSDYQYFLQNSAKDCTTKSDERINAQRFCFKVPIRGAVYPQVSNFALIKSQYKALTKPYPMSIYTQETKQEINKSSGNHTAEKIVLLPFALAFDVVTFPIQLVAALD